MTPAEVQTLVQASGFALEHQVTELLAAHGWSVINSRYYLDDVEEVAREIDLVAYRAREHNGVLFYTVLMVSCKRSIDHGWVIISRDADLHNPNFDWFPFNCWSNDRPLRHTLNSTDWREDYLSQAELKPLYEQLLLPSGQLMGCQELDSKKAVLKSDRAMFLSVASLMKAQSYELSSLEARKRDRAFYIFNLLAVHDGEMFDVCLTKAAVGAGTSLVDSARYVLSYIVQKRQTSSRVHFVALGSLDTALSEYDRLVDFNASFFDRLGQSFYNNAVQDPKRVELLIPDLRSKLLWFINSRVAERLGSMGKHAVLDASWTGAEAVLDLQLPDATPQELDFLNSDTEVLTRAAKVIKDLWRYEGPLRFTDDEPF